MPPGQCRKVAVAIDETPLKRVDLVRTLDAMPGQGKDRRIFLRADRAVPYGELMDVLERLRVGGYAKVALVANEGVPDISALPGAATGSDSQVPAAANDPTTQPGNSGAGQPPAQAQGVPAAPAAHEPSPPHGQWGGPAEQDPSDLASAVAV